MACISCARQMSTKAEVCESCTLMYQFNGKPIPKASDITVLITSEPLVSRKFETPVVHNTVIIVLIVVLVIVLLLNF